MKERELRRSMAVLPIGTVMKLTDLSARQIRYYEDQNLIAPKRNEGNRRMYSLRDIDMLLEIKDYLSEGYTIAKIKAIYREQTSKIGQADLSDNEADIRQLLQADLLNQGGFNQPDRDFSSGIF